MRITLQIPLSRQLCWLAALLVAAAFVQADDPKDKQQEDKPATPAEQYQTLTKEYETAEQEFFKQYREAKSDEERSKLFEKYPVKQFIGRFLEFAEKYSKDATAFDALMWVVQRAQATDPSTAKAWEAAVDTLIRDHMESDKIGGVTQSMVYSYSAKGEKFLRIAMERNPHEEVQGLACMALAQYLKGQVRMAENLRGRDAENNVEQIEKFFGKETVQRLRETDLKELTKEVEVLCERVIERYSSIKHWRGTLRQAAEGELFELRKLAIGKVAPDIEGEDLEGVPFKLSDYRGKVVVLDFWGNW